MTSLDKSPKPTVKAPLKVFMFNEFDFIEMPDGVDSIFDRFFNEGYDAAIKSCSMKCVIKRSSLPSKLLSRARYNFVAALIEGKTPGKKRDSDEMFSLKMPFDANKFNFTKISSNEVLFRLESTDGLEGTIIINKSPIEERSALLVPSLNKKQPQVLTLDALVLAIQTLALSDHQSLRFGFNSLGIVGSVNHLHWHCFYYDYKLSIEQLPIVNNLLKDWPIPTIVFEMSEMHKTVITDTAKKVMRIVDFCLATGQIAHSLLISRTANGRVRVFLWLVEPRFGQNNDSNISPAFWEFAGYFICKTRKSFDDIDELQCLKVLQSVESHHDKVLHLL